MNNYISDAICKNCEYANPAKHKQVICKKTNEWNSELYSCGWFVEKESSEEEDY